MQARMPALGIDAGGTATRWALAMPDGSLLAQGETAPLSGLVRNETEQQRMQTTLQQLSRTIADTAAPHALVMGITGLGDDVARARWFVRQLRTFLPAIGESVYLMGDLLFAYLSCITPGTACLVYAGTGSVAVYVDAEGGMHRAGGRGSLLDDAGAGYWIAREALRLVWRREDEQPGSWQTSPMARRLFATLGGSSWDHSREFIYQRDRGSIGQLALQVAQSAEDDPLAADILRQAGGELARLGNSVLHRFGARPIVLSGRAAALHPLVYEAMQQQLEWPVPVRLHALNAHVDCAIRLAALQQPFMRILVRHNVYRPLRSTHRGRKRFPATHC
ncbi:MAG: hypothetical protein KDI44_05705 [Thiothrix sp.]|nr:hypothetical protein [Thiothrix sp.]HPQ95653.1 BadF/BadG/BcrA/BcrD ATPase family protein [Thiolinea sp.]